MVSPVSEEQNYGLLSRMATNDGHGENSCYFDGWKAYENDPFHPTLNPGGVIQMGLGENQLCLDMLQEWIEKHPEASICTAEGASEFKRIANFQDYHGLPEFRQAIANFMGKVRGGRVKFDADRVVMSGGATGAQEILAFCLADPGDAFLIPTPYYPAFDRDFRWRTGVQLLPIHCSSSNGFKVTEAALESAYEEAQMANIRVKGVLIANPSNPLGTTMDERTLTTLLTFTNRKRIHLVCDEIFAGTVFDEPKFTSITEMITQDDPTYDRDLIHIACSLSKDLGLPGFRIGIVYSYNDTVVNCARRMSSFGLVSSQTQWLIASMLSDEEFTHRLLSESAKRLSERHAIFTSGIGRDGIQCLTSNAGLFCWMDLRKLLKEDTVERELELWKTIVEDVKLNVSPGSSFHCGEPGWFRVCFANLDHETLEEALRRIRRFMEERRRKTIKRRREEMPPLSLPRTREDMSMGSCLPSPHSPLVRATS
ncbi:1-aminocyclopropane-1-carboxylate synthase-like [Typha latifolia]|uniref:1-aminocyclopropane-1-carboxylate synthase-like n=1 Tax=Typha latifolia TaxID=4733 RepID=UPI003C2E9883